MDNKIVRVRFAPAPTGHLHLGGARVAIFNWLFAKSHGGKFLLRIEDTDVARSKEEYNQSILESLDWLGITPDEKPLIQTSRSKEHLAVANSLVKKGLAYKCFCSQNELTELREGSAPGFLYPGTCWDKRIEFQKRNDPFVIRLRLPVLPTILEFNDLIKGTVRVESKILDDFVLIKNDSVPTYNFAVVLDDAFMNITHVLRGEDHIINTFKQIVLYNILEQPYPMFGHFPMILSKTGEKLSKRDGATSVVDYKLQGYLPDAMFNYLVKLGWAHKDQEIFSRDELIQLFSLSSVGVKNSCFDTEKLTWLNSVYIKKLALTEFLNIAKEIDPQKFCFLSQSFRSERVALLFELYKTRANTILTLLEELVEIENHWEKFNIEDLVSEFNIEKRNLLIEFLNIILKDPNYKDYSIIAKSFLKEKDQSLPVLAKPLRFLLTGKEDGPSAFEIMNIFGIEYLRTIHLELKAFVEAR